jgi:hypothetical protein
MSETYHALKFDKYADRDLAEMRAGRAAYRFLECFWCVCG